MTKSGSNEINPNTVLYDIGVFIANHRKNLDKANFQKQSLSHIITTSQADFGQTIQLVENHFDSIFDTADTQKSQERLAMQHDAIIGIPRAVSYFKDEITDFLRKRNLLKVSYPEHFHNLTDAIFHNLFGLGPLAVWYNYPTSQAAHVIGKQIFFEIEQKLVKQSIEFDSTDRVAELVRALTLKDQRSRINQYNPKLEVDMVDGTRVTMFVPPLSRHISITFRRFIVSKLTFEDQASRHTIPGEAVEIFRALNQTRPNMIIAGPVKSGKSTMLNTFYGEREHEQKVVCVEKHAELKLGDHYPGRPLDELVATEEELLKLFPSILRTDFLYLIVGELRSVEAELCMLGCERGSTGLLTTYHTKHAHNIPGQLARLILDSFPNRRFEAELVRVAENIDIVIVMDELPDKSKRVECISELRLDPVSLRVSAHELIKFDETLNAWVYKCDLSNPLVNKLYKNDPHWAEILINSLKDLESRYPMREANVTFANTPCFSNTGL